MRPGYRGAALRDRAAHDPDPAIRKAALEGIFFIRRPDAATVAFLQARAANDAAPSVRATTRWLFAERQNNANP